MIGWLKQQRERRAAKREREDAMYLRQAERDWAERRAFVERMIDRTSRGLVDWTQPVPIGDGLVACHYLAYPSRLYVGYPGGRHFTEYWLMDERARELQRLIQLQQSGRIRMAG